MFLASSPLAADPTISASATSDTASLTTTSGQQVLVADMAAGLSVSRESKSASQPAVVVARDKIKGIPS
jgi:hypothetical protein